MHSSKYVKMLWLLNPGLFFTVSPSHKLQTYTKLLFLPNFAISFVTRSEVRKCHIYANTNGKKFVKLKVAIFCENGKALFCLFLKVRFSRAFTKKLRICLKFKAKSLNFHHYHAKREVRIYKYKIIMEKSDRTNCPK